jgi:tRNA G18 (ribose-2'-O)-methylase SpoU
VTAEKATEQKRPARQRADQLRDFRCKNLIVVIEEPENPRNIGTVIRNVNALGAEKVYVVALAMSCLTIADFAQRAEASKALRVRGEVDVRKKI